ncbi:MAG: alpha-ketoglutarate-dependent dioxygenase AlkB family protein [Cyanobacteriota bacterium]
MQILPLFNAGLPTALPQWWERPGLRLELWPGWLQSTPLSPRFLHNHLHHAVAWRQPEVSVYGKRHPVPRLTCWLGDPGCTYRYSGLLEQPEPWTEPLLQLRQLLEAQLGAPFHRLLLNRYRDGRDRMGWHADDERELAAGHPIASLRLGASRTLRFRPHPGMAGQGAEDLAPFGLPLQDGDLLVMHAPTQSHWQHALPARLAVREERLNLTFRLIARPLAP